MSEKDQTLTQMLNKAYANQRIVAALPEEQQARLLEVRKVALGDNFRSCDGFDMRPAPGAARQPRTALTARLKKVAHDEQVFLKLVLEDLMDQRFTVNQSVLLVTENLMATLLKEMDTLARRVTAKALVLSWNYDWDQGLALEIEAGFTHYKAKHFYFEELFKVRLALTYTPRPQSI